MSFLLLLLPDICIQNKLNEVLFSDFSSTIILQECTSCVQHVFCTRQDNIVCKFRLKYIWTDIAKALCNIQSNISLVKILTLSVICAY